MLKSESRKIILRHDVDGFPGNSLKFAQIQANAGIRSTYFFRAVSESWNEEIVKKISEMGHEVGYHYEDLGTAAQRLNSTKPEEELVDQAMKSFKGNLEKLRQIVPVKTICMHGSPLSKWDSRLLWKYYDYREFGIIGEPYFDIDFDEVLYLTDTGRRWDGDAVSVRDKASGVGRQASGDNPYKDWKVKPFKYKEKPTPCFPQDRDKLSQEGNAVMKNPVPSPQHPAPRATNLVTQYPAPRSAHPAPFIKFHSTSDIIKAAEEGRLPDQILMTFHPQRWTDKPLPWVKELMWQNIKNVGKYYIIRLKGED